MTPTICEAQARSGTFFCSTPEKYVVKVFNAVGRDLCGKPKHGLPPDVQRMVAEGRFSSNGTECAAHLLQTVAVVGWKETQTTERKRKSVKRTCYYPALIMERATGDLARFEKSWLQQGAARRPMGRELLRSVARDLLAALDCLSSADAHGWYLPDITPSNTFTVHSEERPRHFLAGVRPIEIYLAAPEG